jgi:O-antigen/teichoic acid export membrane protein
LATPCPVSVSDGAAKSGLARATMLNLAGQLVPLVAQLVTVPLYIKTIGPSRYGVLALAWLLLGYFGIFDLGFGRAMASRMAGKPSEAGALFWTGTALSVLAGALGGLLLYAVAERLFTNLLVMPPSLLGETQGALLYLALALPLVTGISALSGTLQGLEAFGAMNLGQLTGNLLYQILPLIVAYVISPCLPALVLAAIAGRLVTALMLLIFCARRVPGCGWPRLCRSEIPILLRFGGWVTVTGIISPLLTVFDRFVIGAVAGMAAVTNYTIPYNLVMRLGVLPGSLQNALFPRFAKLPAAEAGRLQAQTVGLIATLATPPLVAGLLGMKLFLSLWIGPDIAKQAVPIGDILILGLWVNMLAFIPFGFLQSRGRPDLPAKFHLAELLVYAPLLYGLTRRYGPAGAAWAWDARSLADAVLLFAAVGMLGVLAACWGGLLVTSMAFAWANAGMDTTATYWPLSAILLAASLVWAGLRLPPGIWQVLRA